MPVPVITDHEPAIELPFHVVDYYDPEGSFSAGRLENILHNMLTGSIIEVRYSGSKPEIAAMIRQYGIRILQ